MYGVGNFPDLEFFGRAAEPFLTGLAASALGMGIASSLSISAAQAQRIYVGLSVLERNLTPIALSVACD